MVNFLLENGADINAKTETREKETPLYIAVSKACPIYQKGNTPEEHQKYIEKYVEIIKLLIAKKADINGSDPLGRAVMLVGNIDVVKLLVENGAIITNSHLHSAANDGNTDIVEFLIDNGADIHSTNARGDTPLHRAAMNSQIDVIELLIKKGVNVDARNNSKSTPLHEAICMLGNENTVLTLVRRGADPWIKDEHGRTPIDYYVDRWENAKLEGVSGIDECIGYLMKLKQAYNKDLIVRYSTMLLSTVVAFTLFTTGNVTSDVPHIVGAVAIVTAAAFAAGRITYEIFKPGTKMEEVKQDFPAGQYQSLR